MNQVMTVQNRPPMTTPKNTPTRTVPASSELEMPAVMILMRVRTIKGIARMAPAIFATLMALARQSWRSCSTSANVMTILYITLRIFCGVVAIFALGTRFASLTRSEGRTRALARAYGPEDRDAIVLYGKFYY